MRASLRLLVGGLAQIRECLADSGGQAGAHFEQRVGSAHQHSADGDRAHNVSPNRIRHSRPIIGSVGWNIGFELRPKKKDHQRNHQAPGQHAACKLDRRQLDANDVAHAEISRAHAGRREHGGASSGQDVRASRRSQANLTVAQTADANVEVRVGGEQAESAQDVHHAANADIPEKIFRGLRAALPGLVNFRRRQRFREGQFWIFHHGAAHQGNEQNAENAAHHDQRGGFPVSIGGAERWPRLGQQKRGQRENRSGGDGLADGARGSSNIFFEQRSLPRPHGRHRNHCRRIRGRDGDTGAQPEISVGCSQDDRHQKSEQHCAQSELLHLHVLGNERDMFLDASS